MLKLMGLIFILLTNFAGAKEISSNDGLKILTSLEQIYQSKDVPDFIKSVQHSRLIALGESAHASKGYGKLQLQLIRLLVRDHGVRQIMLEHPYLQSRSYREYLNGCQGNLNSILHGMRRIRQVEEFANLSKFLCEWNRTNPDQKVNLVGFDLWDDPWATQSELERLSSVVLPRLVRPWLEKVRNVCWGASSKSWEDFSLTEAYKYFIDNGVIEPTSHEACLNAVKRVQSSLAFHYGRNPQFYPREEIVHYTTLLKKMAAYQKYFREKLNPKTLSVRDRFQGEVIADHWLFQNKVRSVILGHNLHIAKRQSVVPNECVGWSHVTSAGEWLRKWFGSDYKAYALTGFEVAAERSGPYVLPPARSDVLDYRLSSLSELPIWVSAKSEILKEQKLLWLHQENSTKCPDGSLLDPKQQYDGLFFLRHSPADIRVPKT